jgi:hypothetical protein
MGENRKLLNTFNAVSRIKDLIEAMNPEATIRHIRGDADSAFGRIVRFEDVEKKKFNVNLGPEIYRANIFTTYLKDNNIELFLSPSQYTNKNRVVDRVIRTIRDKIGENPNLIFDPKIMAKVVEEYNNTPHNALDNEFTPKQVQMHKDLDYKSRNDSFFINQVKCC